MCSENVETAWNDFWKGIVCDENGVIDIEQVKKELYDFKTVLDNISKVYIHIIGGMTSNPLVTSETIINLADEYYYDSNKVYIQEDIACNIQNILIEKIAELEHEQWVTWAESLIKSEHLTKDRIDRWRSCFVPYDELSEEMKDFDRIWASKAINIVTDYLENKHE